MIPNRCMFVYLGPMQFSLVSYLAIRSAATVNKVDDLVLYYDTLPTGPWWEKAREHVTRLVQVDPPQEVGGVPLRHPAHQSDVIRLERLVEEGGIYLDLDVISVKPLTPFLKEHFVLGQEGKEDGLLCNGVILSEPGSAFGEEWLKGIDPATSRWGGFRSLGRDAYWNEYSCQYPAYLATLFPELVTIAPYDSFHWPTWHADHLELLFRGKGDEFPNAFCHHLWQSLSWDPYLKDLTPDYIQQVDTNFNLLVRKYFD